MKKGLIIAKVLILKCFIITAQVNINEVIVPKGVYDMGDHFGFVDPGHPSDEVPIHSVKVDSFYIAKYETTNQQFLTFLQSLHSAGTITVANNKVYPITDTAFYYFTNQFENWYSIGYSNNAFSIVDFRANHPVNGVMWQGAIAFCNWLSVQNNLQPCYNLSTGVCNFSNNGFRLPTEAEWEWAARGGHQNPYFNYACGDTIHQNQCNLPSSGDPYEAGSYPYTTPVGFYDGSVKQKSQFNWPGSTSTYQTMNGANGFGVYDMQGNVWELINDWYGQDYYANSPFDNPKGPTTGFIMPDGKPYHGMRGGNWYNGLTTGAINDGHSRVSNRNPSYYRGPQDPNHPWYHIGFRVARKYDPTQSINEEATKNLQLLVYPNPASDKLNIEFTSAPSQNTRIDVYDVLGNLIDTISPQLLGNNQLHATWNCNQFPEGVYYLFLKIDQHIFSQKIVHKN